jgi:hypothetical protein
MKLLRSSVFALMLGAAFPAHMVGSANAQAIDINVEIAPPPLPFYEQPVIPAEGYIWVPGYWAWDSNELDYYWVPGTWVEPPQPELLWTPAYWGWFGGRYAFHPGYWGREVGFYGGIDYGFGYTGAGYFGGHWDHGAFFYNREVNNITNVRITNVYNQTVIVNNTVNRASFNGGNGGTTARPTPQQEEFARQQHVAATPAQQQHVEAASRDRALFSKQNHGEPAIAATARPGVLQGEGVTRASRTPVGLPAAAPNREPVGREEMQRPGEVPRETGREPQRVEEKAAPVEEPRRQPQEAPRVEPRPAEAPRVETPREPAREEPRAEPRAEPRPEPRVEERRPAPEAVRPAAPPREVPQQRVAPPPRPAAPRPPQREEERK